MGNTKLNRVLLKLSGEALANGVGCENGKEILNYDFVNQVCATVHKCVMSGTQIAIVVGGGNIWRGARQGQKMDRTRADQMGMLATVINSIALKEMLIQNGQDAVVMTSVTMGIFAEPFNRDKAIEYLNSGKVVIFGGGLGSPYFSTDTPTMLRGAEIEADMVMLAKNIDGVYTADPKLDKNAKKLDSITYEEIIENKLKVIDLTAACFGMDNKIPVLIFGLDDPENITKALNGENIGTKVLGGKK